MKKNQQVLLHKRALIIARVTKFQTFIEAFTLDDDIIQVKVRLAKVQKAFDDFDEIQTQVELNDIDETQAREDFEESYYNALSSAETIIEERNAQTESSLRPIQILPQHSEAQSDHKQAHIKLPTISLQNFNGNYDQWMSFHDNFSSLVHENKELSDVKKLHYLKSVLRGDACQILQALESTNQNYEIAWSLLKERYENKRVIIKTHVDALFNLPCITRDSHSMLRLLIDSVSKHLRSLKALNEPVDQWDTLIIHLLASKLDSNSRREWETDSVKNDSPTLEDLIEYLKRRCQILETLDSAKVTTSSSKTTKNSNFKPKGQSASFYTSQVSCYLCQEAHYIFQCEKFLSLSVAQRIKEVDKLKLCANCLRKNHQVSECKSSSTCKTCSQCHNTLLHVQRAADSKQLSTTQSCSHLTTINHVLLATALVNVYDKNGCSYEARALLDAGSQTNFMTKHLASKLQIPMNHINAPVSGINQSSTRITHSIDATIKSRISAFTANLTFMVLENITINLPILNVDKASLNIPQSIQLADPKFHETGPIDILIGAEIFWNLMSVGQIKLAKNKPFLQKTQLGWIVSGRYIPETSTTTHISASHLSIEDSLSEKLTKFWIIEEDSNRKYLTKDEQRCEHKFMQTTKRSQDGRFIVELPFKKDPCALGDSREIALKRFYNTERKLQRDPMLKRHYCEFMDKYLKLGHMKLLTSVQEVIWPQFYLPHHAVFKAESTTTKTRIDLMHRVSQQVEFH